MTVRLRLGIALALLAALGGGFVEQLGAHAHAFGEIDLVAHSLVAIDHAPAPHAATHFDRARELRHPVCLDCVLAALGGEPARQSQPALLPVPSTMGFVAADSGAPSARIARRAPARAPPAT
jgi:hypothetical protein